ncbi:MAG: hypothetical protein ACRD2Y_04770 [Terriglobales bacterium]
MKGLAQLRNSLMAKLHVKRAQFYNRIREVANRYSLTTAEATMLLAAQNRINLTKLSLPQESLEKIRPLLVVHTQNAPPSTRSKVARRNERPGSLKEIKPADVPQAVLDSKKISEGNEMALVYQRLYVLENSIRQFITQIMQAKHGPDWWERRVTSGPRDTAKRRMSDEERDTWHQRRGKNPPDYLDLNQLPAIVRNNQDCFIPDFLPTLQWFEAFINELYASRCVVCHMNPLDRNNIAAVEVRFNHWKKLVLSKQASLEGLPS